LTATIDKKLILIHVQAKEKGEVLKKLAELLEDAGFVKDTYYDAVAAREAKYPTGLPTQPMAIAIPHCDAEHCIKPAIAVATLQQPVEFGIMGDEGGAVNVNVVFLLALDKKTDQAEFLGKLSNLFQNGDMIEHIARCPDSAEIASLVSNYVDF
jgi:galactitol PTS system EIIA component